MSLAHGIYDAVCCSGMRKIVQVLLPTIFFLCLLAPAMYTQADAAETTQPVVTVRAAKHADFFRIVLGSTDSLIGKAAVSARENSSFRIDFPAKVIFELGRKDADGNPIRLDADSKKPVNLLKGITISARPSGLSVTVDGLIDMKTTRLGNPARLVIDAVIERKSQEKADSIVQEKTEIPVQVDSLIIDPGHGGEDKGIHTANASEKDIVLGVARDLAAAIAKNGKKAVLTRKGDQMLSPEDRVVMANQLRGVPFVSIHTSLRKEVVVYYSSGGKGAPFRDRSEALAQRLAAQLKQELQVAGRAERLPGLFIAGIPSPAVLVELPSPATTSYDRKVRERVLRGLLKGLAAGSGKEDSQPAVQTPQKNQKPAEPVPPVPPKPKKKIADEI